MVNDALNLPPVRFCKPLKSRSNNTTMRAVKAVAVSALLLQFAPVMGAAQSAKLTARDTLNQEIVSLINQGHPDRAVIVATQALALAKRTQGVNHVDVAARLSLLANVYRTQAKYAEAEPLYQRALTIREKSLGAEHLLVAEVQDDLAYMHLQQGNYSLAEPLYQHALAVREQSLGPIHLNVAMTLYGLANLYADQKKPVQAEPLYLRALAIREKALGPDALRVSPMSNTSRPI